VRRVLLTAVLLSVVPTSLVGDPLLSSALAAPAETDRPDLVSVTLDPTNAYLTREAASFCFDAPVSSTITAGKFRVKTYDASRYLTGQTATLDGASGGKCVVVTFHPVVDLKTQGSIGEVDASAVTASGLPNSTAGAPLTGSVLAPRPGQTTGPDLVATSASIANHTVEYTFDQQIDPMNIDATQFGTARSNGAQDLGTSVALVDNVARNMVRIQFPNDAELDTAVRYFVRRGAVRTLPFDGVLPTGNPYAPTVPHILNPPGVVGQTPTPGAPVLTGAQPQGDPVKFRLTYSSDLSGFDATKILAVRDNGEVEAATFAEPIAGSTRQRLVSFPLDGAVQRDPGAVVAIVSQVNAVSPSASTSAAAIGTGAPFTPGLTTGPDLLNATADAAGHASFVYDEPVDTTAVAVPASFQLLPRVGAPIGATAAPAISADHRTLQLTFPAVASGGVAALLGATQDLVGNSQPNVTVGFPLPPPADTTVNVALGKVKVKATAGKHGKRTLKVPVTAGEAVSLSIKLERKKKVLAKATATVAAGSHAVKVKVSKKAGAGKATLTVTATDAAGNTLTLVVKRVRVPRAD
jgi:hypothetical protein